MPKNYHFTSEWKCNFLAQNYLFCKVSSLAWWFYGNFWGKMVGCDKIWTLCGSIPPKLPLKEIFPHNHCHSSQSHYSIFGQRMFPSSPKPERIIVGIVSLEKCSQPLRISESKVKRNMSKFFTLFFTLSNFPTFGVCLVKNWVKIFWKWK